MWVSGELNPSRRYSKRAVASLQVCHPMYHCGEISKGLVSPLYVYGQAQVVFKFKDYNSPYLDTQGLLCTARKERNLLISVLGSWRDSEDEQRRRATDRLHPWHETWDVWNASHEIVSSAYNSLHYVYCSQSGYLTIYQSTVPEVVCCTSTTNVAYGAVLYVYTYCTCTCSRVLFPSKSWTFVRKYFHNMSKVQLQRSVQ